MTLLVIKLFHIMFAATWFGTGLALVSDARRSIAAGAPHLGPLYVRLLRAAKTMIATSILTVVSGLAMVFYSGGFKFVAVRYHIGLSLGLVALLITLLIHRVANQMAAVGEPGDATRLGALRKQLAALSGVLQLLWCLTLATMVLPILQK